MDEIEGRVRLPEGAYAMADYARFYAKEPSGKIIGVYLIPAPPMGPEDGCSELQADLTLKPLDCSSLPKSPHASVKANERKWLERDQDLPGMNDGGCAMVTVVYQPLRKAVEAAHCNGSF